MKTLSKFLTSDVPLLKIFGILNALAGVLALWPPSENYSNQDQAVIYTFAILFIISGIGNFYEKQWAKVMSVGIYSVIFIKLFI